MTNQGTTPSRGQHATRAAGASSLPTAGGRTGGDALMVRPFPQPGPSIRAAMEQLQLATVQPPIDENEWRQLGRLPRPWDPASCCGEMRRELWAWLDLVAMWVNEQHLWNVTRPGIPECWPAHPHLVHDLALLACSRFFTSFAVTPTELDDWHRYDLPGFLERLRDRLGDACQPGRHQPRPRNERDESHASARMRAARELRHRDDVNRASGAAATVPPSGWTSPTGNLHADW